MTAAARPAPSSSRGVETIDRAVARVLRVQPQQLAPPEALAPTWSRRRARAGLADMDPSTPCPRKKRVNKTKNLNRLLAAFVVVVLAFILASCGGGGGEQAPPNPAPTETAEGPDGGATTPGAPAQFPPEFVECMEKQGIDTSSPEDFHAPGAQRAFEACQEFLHGGEAP